MSFISDWDTGQTGADWDSGLQWDVNVGPSIGDVQAYLNLITSEHNQQPDFMQTVRTLAEPLADLLAVLASIPQKYDVDYATGVQLDSTGDWIGASRVLAIPLTGVYFSFDTEGLGWDQGTWKGPFDPDNFLIDLPDSYYRLLLKARILNNLWDGTIPGAYAIWDELFEGTGFGILIQDLGNMHMIFALTGPSPDAVTTALYKSGELNVRPAGVKVDAYMTPSVPDTPYFGFDVENSSISGFDVGAWGQYTIQ